MNYPKRVLQASGGKDSLACLLMLESELDDITVMWCNTGAAHPDTVKFMHGIKASVPHFLEVKSDQPRYVREVGYPCDAVPVDRSAFVSPFINQSGRTFVDWASCCGTNIWQPMHEACLDLGAVEIIRGQKKCDLRKAPIQSGHVEDGITYTFPLEDWTDQAVMDFLGDRLPLHYKRGERTSRDCVNCTAFLDDNVARLRNLTGNDRLETVIVLEDLRGALQESIARIDSIIGS